MVKNALRIVDGYVLQMMESNRQLIEHSLGPLSLVSFVCDQFDDLLPQCISFILDKNTHWAKNHMGTRLYI